MKLKELAEVYTGEIGILYAWGGEEITLTAWKGFSDYWLEKEVEKIELNRATNRLDIYLDCELITAEEYLNAVNGSIIVKDNELFLDIPDMQDTVRIIDDTDLMNMAQEWQEGGAYDEFIRGKTC